MRDIEGGIGKRESKVGTTFNDGEKTRWSAARLNYNFLVKWEISLEERECVLDFVAERLQCR
ncbi:MAG: hypothetical protein ABSD89_09555 [Halobacteriota archaeon]